MEPSRSRSALVLLLTCASACAQPSIGASSEPIINGERETGYPEVVAVYWTDGDTAGGLCTGTVIGPHAVLTAKHCVLREAGFGYAAIPNEWFYVLETDDIDGTIDAFHRVEEVRTTPGLDLDSDVEYGADAAVLLLRDELTVTPRGIARSGPDLGEVGPIVGFGDTTPGPVDTAGRKYSGEMRTVMVDRTRIVADGSSWTCHGDSGGPYIDSDGNVTGITSFGFDGTCEDNHAVFTRVSAWTSLIDSALAWTPPCEPVGETCNGIDDDCDGSIDDGLGCSTLGAACTTAEACVSGRCEDVNGAMICTRSCLPDYAIDPCDEAPGFHCEVTGCGTGRCAPGATGGGVAGAVCAADTDCQSGYCAELQGRRLCGQQCHSGVTGCPDGMGCNLVVGSDCGACVPTDQVMGPRPFGEACTTDVDCVSEACREPGFCTQDCATGDDCPAGYHCDGTTCALGELSRQGGPCAVDGDCHESAAHCIEAACAAPCTTVGSTMECAPDFVCSEVESGPHCLRPGEELGAACNEDANCRSRLCALTCTVRCDDMPCPEGFECRNAGGADACFPPAAPTSSCACSMTSRAHGLGWAALLSAVLGAIVMRRRRASSR